MRKIRKRRYKDITGQVFHGTCQALWYLYTNGGKTVWLFRCLANGPGCKETFIARTNSVKSGNTKSCGCYNRLKAVENHTTHGMTGTPEYIAYHAMHDRCYNPNNKTYNHYGGKGIKVDWEWHKDNPDGFANYLRDKGYITDPNKNTNDRLDNDSNYGPKNDNGWQDRKTQTRNTSRNIIDDMVEAEFIRDLYKLGYSTASIARAVAVAKGRNCSVQTINRCINEKTWKK